jgi:hypothetical protein
MACDNASYTFLYKPISLFQAYRNLATNFIRCNWVFFWFGKWVYYWFMIKINSLNITTEVLSLIAFIDEFKGVWRALGTLAPERLSALRRVATIESIGSSTRIEGSKMSNRGVWYSLI